MNEQSNSILRMQATKLSTLLRQTVAHRDELTAENDKLRAQLAEVYDWFKNAPISYTNGVEYSGIDEGDVIGWQRHEEIRQRIAALLGITHDTPDA